VIPVSGDHLIAVLRGHLHADDDCLLADVEVAEAADQAHAVHLAGLLLEAPDQQHLAIGVELFVLGEVGNLAFLCGVPGGALLGTSRGPGGCGHRFLRLFAVVAQGCGESERRKAATKAGSAQSKRLQMLSNCRSTESELIGGMVPS
jgi:hypothetical protein